MRKKTTVMFGTLLCFALLAAAPAFGAKSGKSNQKAATNAQAADAAEHFLKAVEAAIAARADNYPALKTFTENRIFDINRKYMDFALTFESPAMNIGTCLLYLEVSRPAKKPAPGGDPYFPGLNLKAGYTLDTTDEMLKNFIKATIADNLWLLKAADPRFGGAITSAATPIVKQMFKDIAALEKKYPALKGFGKDAKLTIDAAQLSFGVSLEKNMGEASMGDPVGTLKGPDSIYVGFHLGPYIEGVQRWEGGPGWHYDVKLENTNMNAFWAIQVQDEELGAALDKIARSALDKLKEMDGKIKYGN
jgi:hypothetical protein